MSDPNDIPAFSEWIKRQANGRTHDELTAALAAVTESVARLERKGTVTLTLAIEPAGSGGQTVTVAAKVTARAPEPTPPPSVYFVGNQGSLHRDDPFQQRMFDDAREAPQPDEVRSLDDTNPQE